MKKLLAILLLGLSFGAITPAPDKGGLSATTFYVVPTPTSNWTAATQWFGKNGISTNKTITANRFVGNGAGLTGVTAAAATDNLTLTGTLTANRVYSSTKLRTGTSREAYQLEVGGAETLARFGDGTANDGAIVFDKSGSGGGTRLFLFNGAGSSSSAIYGTTQDSNLLGGLFLAATLTTNKLHSSGTITGTTISGSALVINGAGTFTGTVTVNGDISTTPQTVWPSSNVSGMTNIVTSRMWYKKIGKTVIFSFALLGDGSQIYRRITLPYANGTNYVYFIAGGKNNGGANTACFAYVDIGGATLEVGNTMDNSVWTASGTSWIWGQVTYCTP